MKKYTIGIVFNYQFQRVILIQKNRPEWQNGKLNFVGGHIEDDESALDCIVREFNEESGILITSELWKYIGKINNEGNYYVEVFTALTNLIPKDMTDEPVSWYRIDNLPDNIISNLSWLIPFAKNIWQQGNADHLQFGAFEYKNIKS